MLDFNIEKECYGCGACVASCPRHCISLEEDEKGFLKARIDKEQCVNCGICETKCIASYKNNKNSIHAVKALYGFNTDLMKRKRATSGGVFEELAIAYLNKGYLIAGCVWDKTWKPKHVLTDDVSTIYKMQRSKYPQSDISEVLIPIRDAVNKGRSVLFSGTPCQIAAVKKFVGDNDKILYVGVVCHGVASRKIWRMYLDSFERKHGKITTVRMREKRGGGIN